ncbi:LapA family protein [Glutamicibacter sp.]|uniref:LapA family protein n=1 Tax=Glutamicibacter sp. TaxID=1931995 RepID=UPI002B45A2C6|nr:lipopolysaccharide assembly protein LapA domain-containing protein [Glutamicibacter sp.]HJX80375.1 lipopolysaccharide assembly protein LapA domain-containing protein [Glutamicibacter sp.]
MTSTPHAPDDLPVGHEATPDSDGVASVKPVTAPLEKPAKSQIPPPEPESKLPATKLGRIWTASVLGLIVLVLLIIFIAQNQDQVTLRYFTYEGQVNLGLALFIAAVAGGLLIAAVGAARVIQLRATARKDRKAQKRR